jgi:uncharacterized protein
MKAKTSSAAVKHVPQRTCIACRKTDVKKGLVRLVATPEKGVEVDPSGKKTGRGAYLCHELKCWETALKTGRLEQALRTKLKADNKESLEIFAKGFDNNKHNSQ